MFDGEGQMVETDQNQGHASISAKPWWNRLPVVWWTRGAISAVALVGLADQLNLFPENWLRVVHAIGTRWGEFMSWITSHINFYLPWDANLSAGEGSALTILLLFLPPILIATLSMIPRAGHRILALNAVAAAIAGVFCAATVFTAPDFFVTGASAREWCLIAFGATAANVVVLQELQAFIYARDVEDSHFKLGDFRVNLIGVPLLALMSIGGGVRLLLTAPAKEAPESFDLLIWATLSAAAVAWTIYGLWRANKAYLKSIVIVVTFIATLELIYLTPVLHEWMRPVIDWIDPDGAAL
jgi:hypothetical protein